MKELNIKTEAEKNNNTIPQRVIDRICDELSDELVSGHIRFCSHSVRSNFEHDGIPKIELQDDGHYTAVLSFDDMRGPQNIIKDLDEDKAISYFVDAVNFYYG